MVDPASSNLGRMLTDEITPVIMVLRTPLVEETSQKNGLSFIEMLSPFCAFNNIDVPVRTASDQPYRLQKFKLRLFYASDIAQPNVEVAKERIKQVITCAGEKDFPDVSTDPLLNETALPTAQHKVPPSWFEFFNRELVHTVSFAEHEAFDHPVACLLAVSSMDEDPIDKFVDLFNTNQLPSLINDGAMDPKILKHFVLVHDNQDGMLERATKVLTEMRTTFGANSSCLLCVNSSEDGLIKHQENPWVSCKNDGSKLPQLGCFLSLDDMDELKKTIQDLSSKHIIPYMEQKIRVLNQQVSATRKGFRNQIRNLWWRKGKDDVPDHPNGPAYAYNSMEFQIRLLGDYAFMLRDYELALSNYRLLSTDYKLDKAWKHYAGVQEMMGLTYFMLDQSRKDAEYCMENAFSTYLKLGSSGQRNATRCGLWWVEMLKARDQQKDAASVYFRISGEEPLHSAVMLEQASYCYMFSTPPLLRKYGFHLILAGDLYKKCDQIKHAIRTYRSALSVFKGTAWNHIKDQVHFHIGKWYAFLGMFDVAMEHMLEILACGHQSKSTQELFLRDFFQVVQNTGKTFDVLKLQLPVINVNSIKVVVEDHRTYASEAATSVKEGIWLSFEEDMIPSLSSMRNNWLESHGKNFPQKYKDSNVCVAGEVIRVDVELKNPLKIPISISSVSLICEHSSRSNETNSDLNSSIDNDQLRKLAINGKCSAEASSLLSSEIDLQLGAGETIVAQLSVIPNTEGILEIVGVRWKLSGSVSGFCKFGSDLLKKKFARGRRRSKKSSGSYLKFLVIKSLPKLEGVIHHLPETVYVGDMRRLSLELKNPSNTPLKNLKMKVSQPRFLKVGDQEVMQMEFPSCLEKRGSSGDGHVPRKTCKASRSLYSFPEDLVVCGDDPLRWPLYLRAAAPGNLSLYISIYYEVGDASSTMHYRVLRMHFHLEILPSLDVSFHISPCPSRSQEFLVRMDVINRTSSESFQFHQLSSVGNEWEISLLQPMDTVFPSDFLVAGQALSCFFKLKNCRKWVNAEDDPSSLVPLEKADIKLVHGNGEALFDTLRSPLVDFHHYERVHQGTLEQDHQTKVDFILISRSRRDDKSAINLFSHHACDCSVASSSPIWWLIEGPGTVTHNFAVDFCEIKLKMIIHNSSNVTTSVHISTFDSAPNINSSSTGASVSSVNEAGWRDISVLNDIKFTSDVTGSHAGKLLSPLPVPPFIWSGTSSTRVTLEPLSSAEMALHICVFSPGTYDVSNYSLHWSLLSSGVEDKGPGLRLSSGTCQGHPYHVTVLQQD
ncbi:trafficking protein particle complex subunit 8 [Coffea eugenioides]|uniref:trafficking protein particle complex subunit 8 n=1 Tax=Coffea eugenioides TaxID=49369 RepID=UPI000F60D6B9|nr:trafficking protein particle complex subunit 8 [Coffea eugenioides]